MRKSFLHEHPFYEIMTLFEGECIVSLPKLEQTINLSEGDCLLLPPDNEHIEYWVGKKRNTTSWIAFLFNDVPPENIREIEFKAINTQKCIKEFKSLYKKISAELNNRAPDADSLLDLYVQEVLILLDRCKNSDSLHTEKHVSIPKKQARILEAAGNVIIKNISSPLQISELAEMFYISPAHFSTIFKAYFGMPPVKFLNINRMKKSAELLKTTTKTLDEISQKVGFSDNAYFCKKFKRFYKMTPTEYRGSNK